jgi:hypothetical protein
VRNRQISITVIVALLHEVSGQPHSKAGLPEVTLGAPLVSAPLCVVVVQEEDVVLQAQDVRVGAFWGAQDTGVVLELRVDGLSDQPASGTQTWFSRYGLVHAWSYVTYVGGCGYMNSSPTSVGLLTCVSSCMRLTTILLHTLTLIDAIV